MDQYSRLYQLVIIGLFYMFVDYHYESKGILHKKRLQYPGRNGLKTIDWRLVNNAIHLSAINTITTIIGMILIYAPLAKLRGTCDYQSIYNYNLLWNILKLPLLPLLTDIIFYVTHRMFHNITYLYQNVHKIHHQFVDTYSLAANACHPIEHIITNMGAVLLPVIILNLPLTWGTIWLQLASINSTFCHSGYVFFKRISPIPHDFHHKFTNIEFGAGQTMDAIFSTDLKSKCPQKWTSIMKPYLQSVSLYTK